VGLANLHAQVGTLEYMSPELLLRSAPPSPASDVYAWAVSVNEMATGAAGKEL
jgi:serine/threonine protein kinase